MLILELKNNAFFGSLEIDLRMYVPGVTGVSIIRF